MALKDSHQQVYADTRRSRSRSAISSEGKVSRRSIDQAAGAQTFCLGVLALILTLPCNCGVGAITFAISGFNQTDVYVVGDSSWIFDSGCRCFYYGAISVAGRFLHPSAVQMKDPGATTVKSFSTSFLYQMRAKFQGINGPGLAFIIVPDNVTLGGSAGYMGVITADTSDTTKNYESDNYTFAVELDTHNDTMFDDPNDNHIGVNLASMNSSHLIKTDLILALDSVVQYEQIWIEYTGTTSTMDIYCGFYGQGKPDKPQGSQLLVDLTYLKKSMYIGFSTGTGIDIPVVYAWSFSNDGVLASPIYIGEEAPPAAPPPPPGVSHPPPPGPGPQAPPPGPAEAPPPPSRVPLTPLPVPPTPSPEPPTPSPRSSPPPINPPAPLTRGQGGEKPWRILLTVVGPLFIFIGIVFLLRWWWVGLRRLERVFVSNTGGKDGGKKNFPVRLYDKLKKKWWFKVRFRLKVFIDKEDLPGGLPFPVHIKKELDRIDLGFVVVSDDFFRKKWPMTELIAFVEAQKRSSELDGRTRVLPLFYELTPRQVKEHVETGFWDDAWKELAQGDHPLDVEECRAAVKFLSNEGGVVYSYAERGYEKEYLKDVIKKVNKILCKERSCASGFWWAVPACIQCRRTPVQSCAEPQIPTTDLQSNRDAGEGGIESQLHNIDDQEIQADCSRHSRIAADRLHRRLEQR